MGILIGWRHQAHLAAPCATLNNIQRGQRAARNARGRRGALGYRACLPYAHGCTAYMLDHLLKLTTTTLHALLHISRINMLRCWRITFDLASAGVTAAGALLWATRVPHITLRATLF